MTGKVEAIFHTEPTLGTEPEWNADEVHGEEVVADKYQGTDADRHDMRMLGRIQVLRVSRASRPWPMTTALIKRSPAQFQLRPYSRLQRCPHLYMGASFCVRQRHGPLMIATTH